MRKNEGDVVPGYEINIPGDACAIRSSTRLFWQ
jgi:hypothetical protein